MKFFRKAVTFVTLSVALAGCQTVQFDDIITNHPPTASHKQLLVEAAKEHMYDPYAIRDAELSNQLRFPNGVVAYCGRFNAKNRLGGYVGRTYVMAFFNNGMVTNVIDNHAWCKSRQKTIRWHKFAALNNL